MFSVATNILTQYCTLTVTQTHNVSSNKVVFIIKLYIKL